MKNAKSPRSPSESALSSVAAEVDRVALVAAAVVEGVLEGVVVVPAAAAACAAVPVLDDRGRTVLLEEAAAD